MRALGILEPWGKTDPEDTGVGGADYHPVIYHLLDVAAVMEAVLDGDPVLTQRIATLLGISAHETRTLLRYLSALHDLGKCAERHLALDPKRYRERFKTDPGAIPASFDHGGALLNLIETSAEAFCLPEGPSRHVWRALFGAVSGHHGVAGAGRRQPQLEIVRHSDFGAPCHDVALEIARTVGKLLPPPARLPAISEARAARASLAIAGLATLVDWMGSNTEWFPYTESRYLPSAYLEIARTRARGAIEETGFTSNSPENEGPGKAQIALVSARPGTDTVNAALRLAETMFAHTLDRGVYIACATRDEADGAFETLKANEDQGRSITLAYADTMRAANTAHPWMARMPHFAFFADIGVGTIDQALLAVTAHRHHTLRLAGLMRRTLIIIDAAGAQRTAGDALERLIEVQSTLGASAVLVAPAWPTRAKTQAAAMFARGRSDSTHEARETTPRYVTVLDDIGWSEHPTPKGFAQSAPLSIRAVRSATEAVAEIARGTSARVLYIRRTVTDALATRRQLNEAEVSCAVLSAQRTRGDRRRAIEAFERGEHATLIATAAADHVAPIATGTLYVDNDDAHTLIARIARHAPNSGESVLVLGEGRTSATLEAIIAGFESKPIGIDELAQALVGEEASQASTQWGRATSNRTRAMDGLVDAERGNRTADNPAAHHSATSVRDESSTPTLKLAVREAGAVRAMEPGDGEWVWRDSEARSAQIARPAKRSTMDTGGKWPKAHERPILIFERTAAGEFEAHALSPRGNPIRVRYDQETGLERERE